MQYQIFISYSRKDTELVSGIEKELKRRHINYFIDHSILLSSEFAYKITDAVEKTDVFLLILTENSNDSIYTAREVQLAIDYDKPIVCLRIGNFEINKTLHFQLSIINWFYAEHFDDKQKIKFFAALDKFLKEKNTDDFDVTQPKTLITESDLSVKYDHVYPHSYEGMTIVIKDSKYGFINEDGKLVIPCKYDEACNFYEGLAKVRTNDKLQLIDKYGNELCGEGYDEIGDFYEDRAYVKKNGKYGYINSKGECCIPLQFHYAADFTEGLARVKMKIGLRRRILEFQKYFGNNNKYLYGFVDKNFSCNGIDCVYDDAQDFSEGLCGVAKNGKYGFIDNKGNTVIPFMYDSVAPFVNGISVVKTKGFYHMINMNNKRRSDDYKMIETFSEGLAVAECVRGTKPYLLIDGFGKQKSDFYSYIGDFSSGLALVSKRSDFTNEIRYGFIDKSGDIVNLVYEKAESFSEGLSLVKQNNLYGYINSRNEFVIPTKYIDGKSFSDGFAAVRKDYDSGYGYIDNTGKVVLKFIYKKANPFKEGLATVWIEEGSHLKIGKINKKGKTIMPFITVKSLTDCEYEDVSRNW